VGPTLDPAGHRIEPAFDGLEVCFAERGADLFLNMIDPDAPCSCCRFSLRSSDSVEPAQLIVGGCCFTVTNEFRRRGMNRLAVTVAAQVEVAADSPAFTHPSKPIGAFMDEATVRGRAARNGWVIAEEIGHGWRCVLPSPEPLGIIELDAIRHRVANGCSFGSDAAGDSPFIFMITPL